MGLLGLDPARLLYVLVALVIAISVHEACHAWMAYNLGDPTAKYLGRLTLNPLAHLDPMGAIAIFLIGFGWGKPVPVNPYKLVNGAKTGMAIVSLAGPLSNVATASLFAIPLRLELISNDQIAYLLFTIVMINISLAVFNLIPLPPLDGFKILQGILPDRQAYSLGRLEQYGPALLFAVIFLDSFTHIGIISRILGPASSLLLRILLGNIF
jgi:Zn-dependent protease